jgi:ATP-dependent Clp protease ATP-binding subunit ClpA
MRRSSFFSQVPSKVMHTEAGADLVVRGRMAEDFWGVEWEPAARDLFRRIKGEAAAVGDHYIGTAHLLLAAVAATPAEQYSNAALTPDSLRATVVAVEEQREPGGMILTPWSQTPRFKLAIERAMQRALAESRALSCRDVWYGLLADPESKALRVLFHLGVPVEELRKALA